MSVSAYDLDNLYILAESIKKSGIDTTTMDIRIKVQNKNVLNKLNRDFFYKNDEDRNNFELEIVDEINVTISGIKFTYYYTTDE